MFDGGVRHAPATWWWLRSLLWCAAAVVCGPIAMSFALTLILVALSPGQLLTAIGQVIAGFYVMVVFSGVAAFGLGAVYLPALLAWGRWGHRLARWERRRGPRCAALGVLAAPAAITVMVSYATMETPFGARGAELARMGATIFAGTWLGLLLPRLLVPALRPGTFARTADGA